MRIFVLLIICFLPFSVIADQCNYNFAESDLVKSIGVKPTSKKTTKDDGDVKRQYEFRKPLTDEVAFSEDAEKNYEPQFYLALYNPPCPERIMIWFYEDNANTQNLSNKALAGRAFHYLTGLDEAIFNNKMKRFSEVQHFESFDERADSKFRKVGGIYSIDVYLN
ncbi:hypothetical protein [Atlantibacter sp.]|uniref:hypothetical protein n=1 Tax=Atlantibacter sp. TaxID=1903473 RepID=UPI0028AEB7A6|nr:hypothetical protein [Atlantibacter sp.]